MLLPMDWVHFKRKNLSIDLPAEAVDVPFGESFYFEVQNAAGHGRPRFTAKVRVDCEESLAARWEAEFSRPEPMPAEPGAGEGAPVWLLRGPSPLCPGGWQADSSTQHPDHVTHSRNLVYPYGKTRRWVHVFCWGHEMTWETFDTMTRRIVTSLKLG
jgi:hypothetical protein